MTSSVSSIIVENIAIYIIDCGIVEVEKMFKQMNSSCTVISSLYLSLSVRPCT